MTPPTAGPVRPKRLATERAGALALTLALALGLLAPGCGDDDDRALLAREPDAGKWRPWVLSSAAQVKVPPPPLEDSRLAEADVRELRAAMRSRTQGERQTALAVARAPAVQPWFEDVLRYVAGRAKDPPTASRNYALVSVAMHDAAIAAWHWKYQYGRDAPNERALVKPAPDPSYPSEHAAIAGAASRVLEHLYPSQPAGRLERQAMSISRSRVNAGVNYPSDVAAGLRLGHDVAKRVIGVARHDGANRKWDGRRPGPGPRYWEPPPGAAARPVSPLAGRWRTWVMKSGRQFRPPPPPRFGTPGFLRQARAVVRAQKDLTPKQKRAAKFWEGGEGTSLPPGIWIQVVLERLRQEPLTTPRTTRLLSSLTVAMADAGVGSWDAKYAYWYPRPENGVRDSGLDKRWTPYVKTPFFPSYVSGHSTYSTAAGEVLAHFFPKDAKLWHARAREAGLSRIWGGIHYPVDNVYGDRMGRKIGRLVVDRAKRDGAEEK